MTIADLDDDSVRRYRMIFNIFALIDVGERSGMGLSNFYSVWDECGYDRPTIEELHEPDQTVLTVKLDASGLRKTSRKKTSTKSEKSRRLDTGLKDEDLVVLRLTSSRVVWALRKNPNLTREELAALLNISLRGIEWQVAKLQKDKAIRRVGGRKFGHWEVLI